MHWSGTMEYGDRIGCNKIFNDIMKDPDMSIYLDETNDNDEPFLNVQCGQSDFLFPFFPNSKQKEYFINILELFAKHKLFLECAIPTAVLMMNEKFGVKVYNAHLCTRWDKYRSDPNELIKACEPNHDYEAFHPIKLGINSNWSMYFKKIYRL